MQLSDEGTVRILRTIATLNGGPEEHTSFGWTVRRFGTAEAALRFGGYTSVPDAEADGFAVRALLVFKFWPAIVAGAVSVLHVEESDIEDGQTVFQLT